MNTITKQWLEIPQTTPTLVEAALFGPYADSTYDVEIYIDGEYLFTDTVANADEAIAITLAAVAG